METEEISADGIYYNEEAELTFLDCYFCMCTYINLLFRVVVENAGIGADGECFFCQWDESQETSGASTSGLIHTKRDVKKRKETSLFCC